ncbi:LacI family DNA-binding transcriptional regulator [Salipiger sp. IMCC34102]|uniref:LacI family DNA-binding transcriptional regulator n=1 Tax=Salipiger sp. IMCC34102 TaxID=2510647 RepID=UPI00101C04F6|nr:LacI family DNA-binding transcriptional regulator [Salipiger sp. IMCC34102]RYH04420.1 LacI family DNA-binding transcriptional regulator [Salipiger sp. IMCC34102]
MTGIRALADSLNISIGTVSRALNNKPGVNEETRARVLEMALRTGYVANAAGRNLRKGMTQTIGLMMGTGHGATAGGDNFFMAVTDAMQKAMQTEGVDLVLLPCHSEMDPLDFLRRTLTRGTIDGIILTATKVQDPRIALLRDARMPFMTLGRSATPGDYLWMDLDFESAAGQAVAHLAELGHRRIAVGIPAGDANLSQLYRHGWKRAMTELGLPTGDDLIFAENGSEEGGALVAAQVVKAADRPTAMLMCSEPMISGFYGGLINNGLRPGPDISVIGFRQSPLLRHLAPPISCFDINLDQLGQRMAHAILTLVYEPSAPDPQPEIMPISFIVTASVQPPAKSAAT